MIEFTVHGVPLPWKRAKSRLIKTPKATFISTYTHPKTAAAEASFLAKAVAFKPAEPIKGPIALHCIFVLPIPESAPKFFRAECSRREVPHVKTPDLDNLEKMVKDALNGVFYLDDKQVCRATKRKFYGVVPRTEIRIEELA